MINRYKVYKSFVKQQRRFFSEVQKRVIASRQSYKCFGAVCKGNRLLPATWELDHIKPLFAGGTNFFNFDPSQRIDDQQETVNNLQVLCAGCHALKTQHEKVIFFAEERKCKYNTPVKFVNANLYYTSNNQENLKYSPYFSNGESKPLNQRNLMKFRYKHKNVDSRKNLIHTKKLATIKKHGL